ncbi:MAG: hypothetical protein O7I93_15750 [Gemmatimonadetes bacterium]|nr:hypothetical protein [Gemmatimonadota bacterium]
MKNVVIRGRLPVLAAALTALVVALPSVVNGFVYDDMWIVEQREAVHQLSELGALFAAPYWPQEHGGVLWRPVTLIGFAVEWAVGGGSPAVFHAVSIALYSVIAGLVALLGTLLFTPTVGLLAGLVFAVHPVHVEVTANVVGQAELWAALGYLVALVAAWRRCQTDDTPTRGTLLAVAAMAVAFGVGAKEHVITFPAALLLLWWVHARRHGGLFRRVVRREWLVGVTTVTVLGIYLVLRAQITAGMADSGGLATGLDPSSVAARTAVMLPVSLKWLQILFVPVWLSADYSPRHLVPDPSLGPTHALALVVWSALAVLVWTARERGQPAVVGAALFAITISIVSNVVVPLEVLLAERLLFLPSVGWALAVGGLAATAATTWQVHQRRLALLAAVVLIALAGRSMLRAGMWRTNETLSAQMLREAPNSFKSHWVLSSLAFERGDSVLGDREMRTAVRLNPDHIPLLEDLGRLYTATGRYEPAIPLLEHAISIDSTLLSSRILLAIALGRTGRVAEALTALEAAAHIHGDLQEIALVRAEMLQRAGDAGGAVSVLFSVMRQRPEAWRLRAMVAEAAAADGQCELAIAQADTAVQLAEPADRTAAQAVLRTVTVEGGYCD